VKANAVALLFVRFRLFLTGPFSVLVEVRPSRSKSKTSRFSGAAFLHAVLKYLTVCIFTLTSADSLKYSAGSGMSKNSGKIKTE